MSNKKKKKPQHSPQHEEVLQKHALEQEEVHEVVVFFKKYSKPAAIAFTAICLVFVVSQVIKSQRIKKEILADAALMSAATPEALQAIIDDYPSTPSAPIALVQLAQIKFNSNKVDAAEKLYKEVLEKYKEHDVAIIAELGLIACREDKALFGEAQQLYSAFTENHKNSYLAPVAFIGEARCLEALDQHKDAVIIYDNLIREYPRTSWSSLAKTYKKVSEIKQK
jgi:tetratricopeptide (TPR) repeat protein